MPKISPISWRKLVQKLHTFGFDGPFQEGKHPYMVKGDLVLTIPNRHEKQIGVGLLLVILKQAEISKSDWLEKLNN